MSIAQATTPEPSVTITPGPSPAILSPMPGGTYAQGQRVATSFACSEGQGGPGLASCVDSNGSAPPSGHLDTSTLGWESYTVTARSTDGMTGTTWIPYFVVEAPLASARTIAIKTSRAVVLARKAKVKLVCSATGSGGPCYGPGSGSVK